MIFDTNQQHIQDIDPRANTCVQGRTYSNSEVMFIGAGLQTNNEVIATLAHEVCHFALHKLYANVRKPYRENDSIRKNSFDKIIEEISQNRQVLTEESIVENVFESYSSNRDTQTRELIVRVPEMYARYHDDPKKLTKCQLLFPKLFEFYHENVLKDLKIEAKKLKMKSMIKLNDAIEFLDDDLFQSKPGRRIVFKQNNSYNRFRHSIHVSPSLSIFPEL
jgi:hypothetical protein